MWLEGGGKVCLCVREREVRRKGAKEEGEREREGWKEGTGRQQNLFSLTFITE